MQGSEKGEAREGEGGDTKGRIMLEQGGGGASASQLPYRTLGLRRTQARVGTSTGPNPAVGELGSVASGGSSWGGGWMVGFPPSGFPMDCWVRSQDPNIPGLPWELRPLLLAPSLR